MPRGCELRGVLVLLQIEAVRCALAAIWPDGGVGWRRLLVALDPDVEGSLPTAVAVRTYETAAVRLCYCVGFWRGQRAIVDSALPS